MLGIYCRLTVCRVFSVNSYQSEVSVRRCALKCCEARYLCDMDVMNVMWMRICLCVQADVLECFPCASMCVRVFQDTDRI